MAGGREVGPECGLDGVDDDVREVLQEEVLVPAARQAYRTAAVSRVGVGGAGENCASWADVAAGRGVAP